MPREKLNGNKRGLWGYQGLFLTLTLVVMIIIILVVKDLTVAIVIIGLITNFLIISSQLTLFGDRHLADGENDHNQKIARADRGFDTSVMVNPPPLALLGPSGTHPSSANLMASLGGAEGMTSEKKEAFTTATTAPPGAGPPAFPNIPDTSAPRGYPGAIDFGASGGAKPRCSASQQSAEDALAPTDEAPALGHVDWTAAGRDAVPVGNPYALKRIASPQAAPPCVDDDAIAIYDGDELNTYQVRSRNDPERVWAGIYRRKALIDRYVREELDERENSRWWGAQEV